jgi:thymidylate synthase ThyX
MPFWFPTSILPEDGDPPDLEQAKTRTREVFARAIGQDEANYAELEAIWSIDSLKEFKAKKKLTSMFRRILPIGVATGGVWTGNIRAIRHVLAMRCAPEAEEEMIFVFTRLLAKLRNYEPALFNDFDEAGKPKYWKV